MQIILEDAGKCFQRGWVFRHHTYHLNSGERWGIAGANGAGKTTLLLCLCGFYALSEGKIVRKSNIQKHKNATYPLCFSICSPYMELLEELTVLENFKMQWKLCWQNYALSVEAAISRACLDKFMYTPIAMLSSGTRQRIKIAQSIYATTPVLLLDEFASHLDKEAIVWAEYEIEKFTRGRLLVIATNNKSELKKCQYIIDLSTPES